MTSQGYEQTQPEPGSAPGRGAAYPEHGATGYAPRPQGPARTKGFVGSLFDFGFNFFVTPKVVKVVYVLVMILIGLGALGLAVAAFSFNMIVGIFTLVILAPLVFLLYLAMWRITLEIFVVIFRIADDLRVIRDRNVFG